MPRKRKPYSQPLSPASAEHFARDFGIRIRFARRARGLTIESLARRTGITKSFLSKIERGDKSPAIATVINLARALDMDLSQLLLPTARDQEVSLVQKSDRPPVVRYASSFGYRYVALTRRAHKRMQPFLITFPRNPRREGAGLQHPGEEFVFVVRGKVLFTVGDEEFVLGAGDALYFDSSRPHWGRSISREPADVLDISCLSSNSA